MFAGKCLISENSVPDMLWLYYNSVIKKNEEPDCRLNYSPSVVPIGDIKCSAFDGGYNLWFASPFNGLLCSANLISGSIAERSDLTENNAVTALYLAGNKMWALTENNAYAFEVPPLNPISALGRAPMQKIPYYYDLNGDVPEAVKQKLLNSQKFESDSLLENIGGVTAVSDDNMGGRYIARHDGVLHILKEPQFDRRKIELYSGGRYVFGNAPSIVAVCSDGEGLWIQNKSGYVHIDRKRVTLAQKAEHYDHLAWELQSVRGSICDIEHKTENYGNNDKIIPVKRYSTNNDALWSVFHGIGEAQRYSVMIKEGNREAAEDSRKKLVRLTENVLLQSHIHGLGNGFICRGYVSVKDKVFIKDGKLDTDGLWFAKSGQDENGNPVCTCVDTKTAHFGCSLVEGKNFLLTEEVKTRLNTIADRPVTDDFVLSAPIPAEIPPRLAKLYREADPYHPDTCPASEDSDIIFKCDTSSEEVIAAFVQYYFTWKHLISVNSDPDTVELGELIRLTAAATLTHLLDNEYCLRDVHGNPTQWGKWFVDYFAEPNGSESPWRHPYYAFLDGPLNAAEFMCILRVAMLVLEGSEQYKTVYRRACAEYENAYELPFDGVTNGAGYATLLSQYRRRLAKMSQARFGVEDYILSINYSDETLAIIAYWPLLELEKDAERNRLLHEGLDEWWDNMRREGNPIYTFAYAALNPGKKIDFNSAVDALNRYPLYLRAFPVKNSERNDVIMLNGEEQNQSDILLPVDECRLHKANTSPFTVDADGRTGSGIYKEGYMYSGNIFTWPYWTIKYYNILDID